MRYGAYLAAKLAAAGGMLYGALVLINGIWPAEKNPPALAPLRDGPRILAYNLLILGWFLLAAGAAAAIAIDQRRRCRTCLRRLRMPLATGSWGRMFLSGRPGIETICPYGHGTLKVEEVQISGRQAAQWTAHTGDPWEELCASGKEPQDRT